MKLRSAELVVPNAADAAKFMIDIWGMLPGEVRGETHYLRGTGTYPYLVSFEEGTEEYIKSITFVCSEAELADISARITEEGLKCKETTSTDPGEGKGLIAQMPEGVVFRFLTGTSEVAPLEGRDAPVKLTHVVVNAADAEASATAAEKAFGFTVSDRTKGMVFVRCNQSHHSTAFARAGFTSLNHIAFEMEDLDAVMRGIGRMRDHDYAPAWGPGRHGPGDNAYAYYIAPYGAVIEFSTAVEIVPDDYKAGAPEDWTWPENRIDQWGISDKDFEALGVAERKFLFRDIDNF